jgi:hypothetical protein
MNKNAASPEIVQDGSGGRVSNARGILSGIASRFTAKARWGLSAAVAAVAPVVLIAESAAEPIARVIACVGNGSIMALAASSNALTMIP